MREPGWAAAAGMGLLGLLGSYHGSGGRSSSSSELRICVVLVWMVAVVLQWQAVWFPLRVAIHSNRGHHRVCAGSALLTGSDGNFFKLTSLSRGCCKRPHYNTAIVLLPKPLGCYNSTVFPSPPPSHIPPRTSGGLLAAPLAAHVRRPRPPTRAAGRLSTRPGCGGISRSPGRAGCRSKPARSRQAAGRAAGPGPGGPSRPTAGRRLRLAARSGQRR